MEQWGQNRLRMPRHQENLHPCSSQHQTPKVSLTGHHYKIQDKTGLKTQYMVRTEEGSVLYLYTKFEADSSIRSKIIRRSQNFEIGSRDPGYAHLGTFYISYAGGVRPPSLYQIWSAQFVQKLLRGSQNLEIRSRDPGHAHLGVVLWSVRRENPSSMSVPNFKLIALFVQKLLERSQLKISKLGQVTQATSLLNWNVISVDIHLTIHAAKVYASSLIHCWVMDESNVTGPF